MKRIYFIDSKTSGRNFIKNLNKLTKNDNIIYVTRNNKDNVERIYKEEISKMKSNFKIESAYINPIRYDSTVFVISELIGKYIDNKNTEFYIVSTNKQFEALIDFYNEEFNSNKKIQLIEAI